jgi:thiaminase
MKSVVAVLSRYEENAKWISKHYEELKKRFRDEWIAVWKGSVVDHDRELSRLVERLRKKYPDNYNEIAVEYVTAKEIELIL